MLKRIIKITLAILFTFTLCLGINAMKANTITKEEVLASGTISKNATFEKFTTTTTSGKQQISLVKAKKDVTLVPYASITKDGIKGKTVLDLVKEYQDKHPEQKVLAGINADYFSAASGITYPINAYITNGRVYKYSNHAKYQSLAFNSSTEYEVIKTNKASTNYYLTIYDESSTYPIKQVVLNGQNIMPSNNEVTFYYKNTTTVSPKDTSVYEIKSPIAYFNLASVYVEGTITSKITSTTSNPCIASRNEEVNKLLEKSPFVIIQKEVIDNKTTYNNQIGIGSRPLKDGIIQKKEDIGDQNLSFVTELHPRSSLGFTEDGDIYIVAVDGRQQNMKGITLIEEAQIMKNLGCKDCFNFDGGGSTELVIRDCDTFKYLNSPSETYRSVVNVMLIVENDVEINDKTKFLDQTIDIDYDISSTKEIKNVQLMLNDKMVNKGKITNLNNNTTYYLSYIVTYNDGSKDITKCLKTIKHTFGKLNTIVHVKMFPTNFKLDFELTKKGFNVIVNMDDPDEIISRVYVLYDDEKVIAIKDFHGYKAEIEATSSKDYTFKVMYVYKVNTITTKDVILDETYSYSYNTKTINPVENNSNSCKKIGKIALISYLTQITIFSFCLLKFKKNS